MTRQLESPKGIIVSEGPVTKDYIKSLTMDNDLNNFRHPSRQQEALALVAESTEGMVYIARANEAIIGYVMFHFPNQYSRWSRHPRMLELGAIEISSAWKKLGIAKALLAEAFDNPVLDEYVVITTEFYWHWDLKGAGLNVWGYQKMLAKLFGSVGFKRRRTDDPEILEHQANMLMVRIGKNVSPAYIKAFEELTYQKSILD
jgi:acetoin utilization protein AcuA